LNSSPIAALDCKLRVVRIPASNEYFSFMQRLPKC
jgi:hypothetical protein